MKTHIINWTIFLLGLSIMSLGISIVTAAGLGTTPISALPLVSSYISGLTFGQTTLIINVAMILGQLLLLRKNVKMACAFAAAADDLLFLCPYRFLDELGSDNRSCDLLAQNRIQHAW